MSFIGETKNSVYGQFDTGLLPFFLVVVFGCKSDDSYSSFYWVLEDYVNAH